MVICTGAGPVTVYTDANGQPTSAPHVCPDCLNTMLATLLSEESARPLNQIFSGAVTKTSKEAAKRFRAPAPLSRAPPMEL
jgi:hypothetical protein